MIHQLVHREGGIEVAIAVILTRLFQMTALHNLAVPDGVGVDTVRAVVNLKSAATVATNLKPAATAIVNRNNP
jgi:hypothetical protein